MALFEAINKDGMIRYLGYSYGTVLGSTLAAMFPTKIDRMVLDGNMNPVDYYHGLHAESAAGIDPAADYFFQQCQTEGATYCPFATAANTSAGLRAAYEEMHSCLRARSCDICLSAPHLCNANALNDDFMLTLRDPLDKYYTFATRLAKMWHSYKDKSTGCMCPIREPSIRVDSTLDSFPAVFCGDWDDIRGSREDFAQWLDLYTNHSQLIPEFPIAELYQCSTWQLRARGRYSGSWSDIRTQNPILFVNSPYDPTTPIESARNASSIFLGSGVLEHIGAGHCSSRSPSNCTMDKVREYFATGRLPDLSQPCRSTVRHFQEAKRRKVP
jgi:pimeloyl-ACP methyl ester carboxylesterase